jgi:3-dehydroquinate dehydratase-1
MIPIIRPIEIRGRRLGSGAGPLICTPVVGRTREAVLGELATVLAKRPDLVEWRVDFFEGIADTGAVTELAAEMRRRAGDTPILFTRRSDREGGEAVPLSEEEVVALYEAVCGSGSIDIVDYETGNPAERVRRVREASRAHGVAMIQSYHNFAVTSTREEMMERLAAAERQGADIAKLTVMPTKLEDVLELLAVTAEAAKALSIPVMTMSMGGYGSLTRMFGWVFGSAITFAVGDRSSAPGQVPIDDLRTVVAITRKALPGDKSG